MQYQNIEINFKILKGNGFIFDEPSQIDIPYEDNQQQQGYFSKFLKYMRSPKKLAAFSPKIYLFREDSILLIVRNILCLYTLKFNSEHNPRLERVSYLKVYHDIKKIYFPPKQFYNHNNKVTILLQHQLSHTLTIVKIVQSDNAKTKLEFMKEISFGKQIIYCIHPLTELQFLIFCFDVKKSQINVYYYFIGQHIKMKIKKQIYNIGDGGLQLMCIVAGGIIKQEQDSYITVFFSLYDKIVQKSKMIAKQLIRTRDKLLLVQQTIFTVIQMDNQFDLLININLKIMKEFFCFMIGEQLIVIKKKFQKYLVMDSMRDVFKNQKFVICKNSTIGGLISNQGLQLFYLDLLDPKCNFYLLDLIQLPQLDMATRFHSFWISQHQHEIHLCFIFLGHQGTLYFYPTRKVKQLQKIIDRGLLAPTHQIGKIQEIGQKLQIKKSQFYLNLWKKSRRSLQQIHNFLLPCYDIKSIHEQLLQYLRKKQLSVSEFIKVLNKEQNIIIQLLSKNLDISLFKCYFKNNFLKRKLKFYPVDFKIDHRQFQDIYSMSIYHILKESIDQQLFPPKAPKCTFGVPEPVQKPKILINHVLQQFRLALLEDYQGFLLKFFSLYPTNVANILENFPYLLPKHPFHLQAFDNEMISLTESVLLRINIMQETTAQQEVWFGNISKAEWDRQSMTIQNIIERLKPYHSTSLIEDKLNQLMSQPWTKNRRLVRHSLIQSTRFQYLNIIQRLSSQKLYLSVCRYANQQALKEENIENTVYQLDNFSHQEIQTKNLTRFGSEYMHEKESFRFEASMKIPMDSDKQIKKYHKMIQNPQPHQGINSFLVFARRPQPKNDNSQKPKPLHPSRIKSNQILPSDRILRVFYFENNLEDQLFKKFSLFSSMHLFLLKQQLITYENSIEDLLQLSNQQLVSLFFLGNKQKKHLIFNEFMQLFPTTHMFIRVIDDFANSTASSQIQLEFLLLQMTGKRGTDKFDQQQQIRIRQFQLQNQQLIQVIINGFCKKIEIRQDDSIKHLFQIISSIKLNLKLHIIFDKITQIRRCFHIFDTFGLNHLTLDELLNHPKHIIQSMLDSYFRGKLYLYSIRIEKEDFSLAVCRNTFNLLLYLRETIFSDITQRQLLLMYGEILIDWQQFEVLNEIFSQETTKEMLGGQKQLEDFLTELLIICLDKIYTDQNIIFDQETIEYVRNILMLHSKACQFTIKEHAKLYIVRLFSQWSYTIRPLYLQIMCIQWQQNQRLDILKQLFSKYNRNITYDTFQELYHYFEIATKGETQFQLYNYQFFQYAKILCEEFLKHDRIEEAATIIGHIRQVGEVQCGYDLQAKCMLYCLSKKKGTEGLNQSRKFIEYMVLNRQNDVIISQLFLTCFNKPQLIEYCGSIEVNSQLCLKKQGKTGDSPFMKKHGIVISLQGLWQISSVLSDKRHDQDLKNYSIDMTGILDFIDQQYPKSTIQTIKTLKNSKSNVESKSKKIKRKQSDSSMFLPNNESPSPQLNPTLSLAFVDFFSAITKLDNKRERKSSVYQQEFKTFCTVRASYFFLLMGLRFPQEGLQNLYCIPYNFNMLLNLLGKFEDYIHSNKSYWRVNVQEIYKHYQRGLYILLLKEINTLDYCPKIDQNNYQQIKDQVKSKNGDIIKMHIARVQKMIPQIKAKKKLREETHQLEVKRMKKLEDALMSNHPLALSVDKHHIQSQPCELMLSYKQLQEFKKKTNLGSNLKADKNADIKQILGQIAEYKDDFGRHYQKNAGLMDLLNVKQNDIFQLSPRDSRSSHQPIRKTCTLPEFQQWITQPGMVKICQLPKKVIEQRLNQIYKNPQTQLQILIQIMIKTKLGNQSLLKNFQKIEFYKYPSLKKHWKKLFPLEFFLDKKDKRPIEIYKELEPVFESIMKKQKLEILDFKRFAQIISSALGELDLANEIYALGIKVIGEGGNFDNDTTQKLTQLINFLDNEYIMDHYTRLMDAMGKPMLRDACHNSIITKFNEEKQQGQY